MAIRSATNLYPGINPHLNSAMQQADGDWQSFHAYHLIHIAQTLNQILPSGYYAKPEQSLQIKIYDPPFERKSKSRPDILVLSEKPLTGVGSSLSERATPTLTLPLTQVIDEMDELTALVIYKDKRPVSRIEFLSPANKPPGSHAETYISKRSETLYGGVHFIEMDFFHEREPTVMRLPSYPKRQPGAYPYHIIVFDARPTFEEGHTYFYGFGVFSLMPLVKILLDNDNSVEFDFGAAYNLTYGERPYWSEVDYTQVPVNFESYTPADQEAIQAHMAQIAAEQPPA